MVLWIVGLPSDPKKCKCNLFTHGAPGSYKNSFRMSVHSRIDLEFGNVGFLGEGEFGVLGKKPLRAE